MKLSEEIGPVTYYEEMKHALAMLKLMVQGEADSGAKVLERFSVRREVADGGSRPDSP